MTLIVCHLSSTEQILVADRRFTDGLTGDLITDEAYKLLLYCNPKAGYQFGLAFTGLATVGKFETMGWLLSVLRKHFGEEIDFNRPIDTFSDDCSNTFKSLQTKRELKKVTFVFVGRYSHASDPCMPFLLLLSNHLDAKGNFSSQVSDTFQKLLITRRLDADPAKFYLTRCLGDLNAAKLHEKWFIKTKRFMRRPISPKAKFELAARFVRRVGRCGSSVGKDVLGLLLVRDKMAMGAEWPEIKGRQETMPHFIHANGFVATLYTPPSNQKGLSE